MSVLDLLNHFIVHILSGIHCGFTLLCYAELRRVRRELQIIKNLVISR